MFINLRRLLVVRLGLLLGLLLLALLVERGLGVALPLASVGAVIAIMSMVTVASWIWLARHGAGAGDGAMASQLAIDISGLTVILYLTGGWTNPLISLYLVPVAVAAATLPATLTWAFTVSVVLAYTGLGRWFQPVLQLHAVGHGGFSLHLTGMWITFAAAAALIAYFGSSMAGTLRRHQQALVAARERNLRNEQIIGVATLAAGTAHELSTPLGSIAVIASELESASSGEARDELRQLLRQVEACRGALQRLREAALPTRERRRADQIFADIRDRFVLLRPAVKLDCSIEDAEHAPALTVDPTLRQAILNLLDNAADASPEAVELHGRWCDGRVEIDILDRGPGLGRDPVAGRGMGMGLLLANATIERLGGAVHATERPGGGTRLRITLPIDAASAGSAS